MANQTLRELAKDHVNGNIDKDSYRKSRAELLQGIVSGSIPLAEIDYPPLVQPPEPESLDDTQRKSDVKTLAPKKSKPKAEGKTEAAASKPAEDTGSSADSETKPNKILFVALGLAVIGIIIVAVIAMTGDSAEPPTPTSSASTDDYAGADAATPVAETTTQAQALIRDFLGKKNWSDSSLDYFLQQWAELPAGDTSSSQDSLEMGQLTNAIYKQLLEEQALSGLVDDDSSLNKQRQLVQFATELGIEDTRISLPEMAETSMEEMEGSMAEEQF